MTMEYVWTSIIIVTVTIAVVIAIVLLLDSVTGAVAEQAIKAEQEKQNDQ